MNKGPEPDMDAELVVRFQRGEEAAFEDLVRRHMRDAVGFSLRLTGDPSAAEELSQDGFVLAYRHLREFRGESSFRTWLYRILVNLNRDRLRRRSREVELESLIRARVEELPDRQREVLVLHVYQGLDYKAIAAALDCSYDDVKVNLSLARKRLREDLRERLE